MKSCYALKIAFINAINCETNRIVFELVLSKKRKNIRQFKAQALHLLA